MYLRTTDTYPSFECKNRKGCHIFFNVLFLAELKEVREWGEGSHLAVSGRNYCI